MNEIRRIVATTLTETDLNILNEVNSVVIKTIALNNTNASTIEATLTIDGVAFLIPLAAKETKFIDSPMVVNTLLAKGNGVNIHISGIQLGGVNNG